MIDRYNDVATTYNAHLVPIQSMFNLTFICTRMEPIDVAGFKLYIMCHGFGQLQKYKVATH